MTNIDINTHEFTLNCLAFLHSEMEKDKKAIKYLKRVNLGNKLLIGALAYAGYKIYRKMKEEIEELKNKEIVS